MSSALPAQAQAQAQAATAFEDHPGPHDDATFESFIDEDAVDADSATPSDDATTTLSSSVEGFASHHASLPNTPKLASTLAFGPTLNADGSSSLHDFNLEWDDLSHGHHDAHPSHHSEDHRAGSAGLFDPAWASMPAARRSADDAISSVAMNHDVFGHDHGDSSHNRSLSLSLHDVASQFLNDLKAQVPQPPAREPFIKMEPDAHMAFHSVGPMLPVAYPAPVPHLPFGHFDNMATIPVPINVAMSAPVASQDAALPREKKRKIEGPNAKIAAARPKKSSSGSKKKTSSQQQQPRLSEVERQPCKALSTESSPKKALPASAPLTELQQQPDGMQSKQSSHTTPTAQSKGPEARHERPAAIPAAAVALTSESSSTPASGNLFKSTAIQEERGNARESQAIEALNDDTQTPTGGSDQTSVSPARTRKPAPKSKKPPPSASQITESGKPFPVIDTSATHSSLFVPPDTSGLTKREARLVKNRAAAFLSRQRKREQFELLEKQCKSICRLAWKMWETIAGPDADCGKLPDTVLPVLLSDEAVDVRDCLEQIVANKGASIAPTEESIANGAHGPSTDGISDPARSMDITNRSSPAVSIKSAGSKREREEESSAGAAQADQDAVIKQLKEKLQAAERREAALQALLAKERAHFTSDTEQPFYPAIPTHPFEDQRRCFPTNSSESLFCDGQSKDSGLSLTVAPRSSATNADATTMPEKELPQPPHGNSAKAAGGSVGATDALIAAPSVTTPKRATTSSMALVVLLFGVALFGTGGLPAASDAPRMGVTRLGPVQDHSFIGSLFDPLVSSSVTQPIPGLLRRKKDDEDEDEEVQRVEDHRPSLSHASLAETPPDVNQHVTSLAARAVQDVTKMLPYCSLADDGYISAISRVARDLSVASHRRTLRRTKSDTSLLTRGQPKQSAPVRRKAPKSLAEHLQQGLILLDSHDEQNGNGKSDMEMAGSAAPRRLKLFLRCGTASSLEDASRKPAVAGSRLQASVPSSPISSWTSDQDEVFEDAHAKTPTSSSGRSSVQGSGPSARVRSSYMELEFSLSSKRLVNDEEELACLIHQAAQRANLGGEATFSA